MGNLLEKDIHLIKDNNTSICYHVPSNRFFEIGNKDYNDIEKYLSVPEENKGIMEERLKFLNDLEPINLCVPTKNKILGRLSIISTQSCNLACKYCFAEQGTYNGVEQIMSLQTYKESLIYILKEYPEGIKLIQFFGGEPLLGFEQIKNFIPYCIDEFRKRGLLIPTFAVVTNGTVFTEEMVEFFNKYKFNVIVSIDGPKHLNDSVRISKTGFSVYEKIKESTTWIKNAKEFSMIAEVTINKYHIDNYIPGRAKEWINEIKAMGFDGYIVGIVESEEKSCNLSDADKETFYEIEKEIVDYSFELLLEGSEFFSADVVAIIKNLAGRTSILPCGAGYSNLAVNPEGNVFPCYQFCGSSEYLMGNVRNEKITAFEETESFFIDIKNNKPKECAECWLRNICSVWCRGFSFNKYGNISQICSPRCWIVSAATENVMLNMTKLMSDPEKYGFIKKSLFDISKKNKYNYNY